MRGDRGDGGDSEDEDDLSDGEPILGEDTGIRGYNSADIRSSDTFAKQEKGLHPLDIDAHWLQRKLSKYYEEAITSQKKSIEVLEIMQKSDNQRELENQLVLLLGYDCFDFIKMLLKHRNMVLFCTLVASAQSEIEKTSIKAKMSQDPDLVKILKQLEGEGGGGGGEDGGEGGGGERGRAAKGGRAGDAGAGMMSDEVARCKVLSLDELAFSQGSHLMANKRCQLPDGSFRYRYRYFLDYPVPVPIKL